MEAIDNYITQQCNTCEKISEDTESHRDLVDSTTRDVALLRHQYVSAIEALKHDNMRLRQLKGMSDGDAHNGELCLRVLNIIKPDQNATTQRLFTDKSSNILLPYFEKLNDEFAERLQQLSAATADVNNGVSAIETNSGPRPDRNELAEALEAEYSYFMSLADRVADLHQNASRLKQA